MLHDANLNLLLLFPLPLPVDSKRHVTALHHLQGKYECECGDYRGDNCARKPKASAVGPALAAIIVISIAIFAAQKYYYHLQSLQPHDFAADLERLASRNQFIGFSPRICSRTLMGCSDPTPLPSVFSRDGRLLPSISADVRSSDDVIAF